jgi:hypothetical protein
MKWNRPVFMEQEEPGVGASFERLVIGADWLSAAELLELGDHLPLRALTAEDAVAVGKYLAPRSLRFTLADGDWHVVPTRKDAQKSGRRLVASAYKAIAALAFFAVALAGQGCAELPLPDDHDVIPSGIERAPEHTVPLYLPQHPDFEAAWLAVGGQGHAPKIVLVEDAQLDCDGDRYRHPVIGCVGGHVDLASLTVYVTRKYLWFRLGHELVHAAKYQATGDSDPLHGGLGGLDVLKWERPLLDPVEAMLYARGWR